MTADTIEILARLERIERLLRGGREMQPDPTSRSLVAVAADFTAQDWFTAKELWHAIDATQRACRATGDPMPYLAFAMAAEGIKTARALGWWLASLDVEVIERSAKGRDGVVWRFL